MPTCAALWRALQMALAMALVGRLSYMMLQESIILATCRSSEMKRPCLRGLEHVTKTGVSCGHFAWPWGCMGAVAWRLYAIEVLPKSYPA